MIALLQTWQKAFLESAG